MQLAPGEQIVCKVTKHWIAIIFPLIIGVCFHMLIIPAIWAVYRLICYFVEEIVLTDRQFYVRTGVISRKVTTIPLRKINAVNYEQGFFGRILGYGTLLVQAGADLTMTGYSDIANPEKTKTMIEHAIENAEVK